MAIFAGGGVLEMIEPINPLRQSKYRCDRRFYTEEVQAANESTGNPIGIIVLDGTGVICGICDGTRRTITAQQSVSLPTKHNKGGQSALRFSRLAEEARANYRTKAREMAERCFLKEGRPWITTIIVGGVGDLKHKLVEELPDCLRQMIAGIHDLAYGGKEGFSYLCGMSEKTLIDSKLFRETAILNLLSESIAKDDGLYVLGEPLIRELLPSGCIKTFIISEEHPGITEISKLAIDAGATIQTICRTTPEGCRFIDGLTGMGALLRWQVNIQLDSIVGDNKTEEKEEEETEKEKEEIFFM